MASTTFTITTPQVLDPRTRLHWENALRALVSPYTDGEFTVSTTVVEPKRTVRIKYESHPHNPREENENAGVMFCKHGRYTLGDKNASDPIVEVDGGEVDGIWMSNDEIEYAIDMLNEVLDWLRENDDNDGVYSMWTEDGLEAVIEELRLAYHNDTRSELRDDIVLCLPIYAYEHGGITVSHGRFSCRWDSGQVGWHYITKQALDNGWGKGNWTEETARQCLKAELYEYDHYLQGNVWYFVVEDEEGDVVDSCSGFIGDDLDEMGMLEHIDEELHEAAREAWNNRFD